MTEVVGRSLFHPDITAFGLQIATRTRTRLYIVSRNVFLQETFTLSFPSSSMSPEISLHTSHLECFFDM